jgi:hypothetical protein
MGFIHLCPCAYVNRSITGEDVVRRMGKSGLVTCRKHRAAFSEEGGFEPMACALALRPAPRTAVFQQGEELHANSRPMASIAPRSSVERNCGQAWVGPIPAPRHQRAALVPPR